MCWRGSSAAVKARRTAVETPIGLVPPLGEGGIDIDGLDISDEAMTKLLEVDIEGWKHQLPQMHEHYAEFGEKLPAALHALLAQLDERLHRRLSHPTELTTPQRSSRAPNT